MAAWPWARPSWRRRETLDSQEQHMCLGLPGKVTETYETNGMKMGRVDFGGAAREICLEYVPETEVGQYVIVHVGFAINVLDEKEALETLELIEAAYGPASAQDPEALESETGS
jgi:hydrogenase expression/formation protein HypC